MSGTPLIETLSDVGSDVWLTPPEILRPLGRFDLDPCAAPEPRPWPTADRHIARPADGLNSPWTGRVWLNPPYSAASAWVGRLAGHGCGTALIFARCETKWFADYVWARASALLFLEGRVGFLRANGRPGGPRGHNATAPSVLVAYGIPDADALEASGIRGAFIRDWRLLGPPEAQSSPLMPGRAA